MSVQWGVLFSNLWCFSPVGCPYCFCCWSLWWLSYMPIRLSDYHMLFQLNNLNESNIYLKRNGGWSTCFSNWITCINAIYFSNKRNGGWSSCFCNRKRGGLLCLCQAGRSSFLQTSSSCHFSFPHNHDEQHDGITMISIMIIMVIIVMIIIAQALPLRHLMQSTGALALRALAVFSQVTLSTECFFNRYPPKKYGKPRLGVSTLT